MKKEILEALIYKWESLHIKKREAAGVVDDEKFKVKNALKDGEAEGRYKCAQDLKQIISILG